MKTRRSIPTDGAVTRPGARSAGNWCRSRVWNLRLELGHKLHPDPLRTTEFAPVLPPHNAQAPARPPSPPAAPASGYASPTTATRLGKLAASPEPISRSNPMEHCAVPQTRSFVSRSNAEKPMEACVWYMEPASAVAARVRCANSGECAWQRASRAAPGECASRIHSSSALPRCGFARLEPKRTPARLYAARATPTHRGEPTASCLRAASHSECDPVPRAASAFSSLPGRERLARNARVATTGQVTIRLFGVPESFATSLRLATARASW